MKDIKDIFESARDQIDSLTKIVLTKNESRKVLRRYGAAIHPNFIVWMELTSLSGLRHPDAQYTVGRNLYDKLRVGMSQKNAHPVMLWNFLNQVNCLSNGPTSKYVQPEVAVLYETMGRLSPIQNLAIMAAFEYCSIVFIPYLAKMTVVLGGTDFEYTNSHNKVSLKNAEAFIDALIAEFKLQYPQTAPMHIHDVQRSVDIALELMKKILTL